MQKIKYQLTPCHHVHALGSNGQYFIYYLEEEKREKRSGEPFSLPWLLSNQGLIQVRHIKEKKID